MLTFTNKEESVKCSPESETFHGYDNETQVIKEMLKSKGFTTAKSIESAHLKKCNSVTERTWVRTVSKIHKKAFVPNKNGTFQFRFAH